MKVNVIASAHQRCLLRSFQVGNVKNKYDADEQAAIQHFEVSQVYKIY